MPALHFGGFGNENRAGSRRFFITKLFLKGL